MDSSKAVQGGHKYDGGHGTNDFDTLTTVVEEDFSHVRSVRAACESGFDDLVGTHGISSATSRASVRSGPVPTASARVRGATTSGEMCSHVAASSHMCTDADAGAMHATTACASSRRICRCAPALPATGTSSAAAQGRGGGDADGGAWLAAAVDMAMCSSLVDGEPIGGRLRVELEYAARKLLSGLCTRADSTGHYSSDAWHVFARLAMGRCDLHPFGG